MRTENILTDFKSFLGKRGATILLSLILFVISSILMLHLLSGLQKPNLNIDDLTNKQQREYWFLLMRKSQAELLYFGTPGDFSQSEIVKIFSVKTGIAGRKPTPLPKYLGREYWLLIKEEQVFNNSEISPYFLTLDIPVSDGPPYGPIPYPECYGACDWELPGAFGLHGVGGDETRLSLEDPGSSGCIRHRDQDITYLYDLLDPQNGSIRYYVEDI